MPHSPAPAVLGRRAFLKSSAAAAAGAALGVSRGRAADAPPPRKPLMAYVGTYSNPTRVFRPGQVDFPPGNGRGIHIFQVDRDTGALSPSGLFEFSTTPNGLALNAAGTVLYSCNETEGLQDWKPGSLSAFAIDPADGHLTLLNTVTSGGPGPAYVSIHPSGRFLFAANYFGGSIEVVPILPDGRLGAPTDFKQDTGTLGPAKATNLPNGSFASGGHESAHAHMIQADPSGRFVLSAEMGYDQLRVWKFDDQAGTLTPNDPPAASLPPGDGPRHFVFHPRGPWLYSLQEEACTVALFDYDPAGGRLTHRQTLSMLPPGFAGTNTGSGIILSPDGRHLYAANRLHDSIAIFAIGETGTLTYVGEEWTRGDSPRTIPFDPTGAFLYSCNQRSDAITTFRRNPTSGSLSFTDHYTALGSPAQVVFVDFEKHG